MPVYEYQCKGCKAKFEKLVKSMSSTDAVACPECGSKKTARELSVFAVSSTGASTRDASPPPGCGRCGGPGPCGMN